MDGAARFLLGGAIGAALGYLLSQRSQQRVALQGESGVAEQEAGASPTAVLTPEAPTEAPEVKAPIESRAVETPEAETPEAEAPEAETPEAADLEAPAVEAVEAPVGTAWWETEPAPVAEAATAEAPVEEAAVEEAAVVEAPEAEQPMLEEPPLEAPPAEEAVPEWPVVEAPTEIPAAEVADVEMLEAEVVEAVEAESVAPQAPPVEAPAVDAAEPLPSGIAVPPPPTPWWETPAPGEEAPVAETPVAEEEASPVEVEPPAAEAPTEAAEPDITLAPEFLDEPVEAPGWTSTAPMVEEEDIESILPVVPDEFPAMEAAEIERPVAEAVPEWTDESLDIETPAVEMPIVELPVVEAPEAEVMEAEVAEAPAMEAPVVEASSVETAPRPAVDDLKARIEETRRRIRQELEQPFIAGAETPAALADDWTVAPAVPVEEVAAGPEPELAEVSEPELSMEGLDTAAEMFEEPVDYESMKSRIESVRSRLKAKAFDAMMSGESALLGRDSEDAGHRRSVLPDVDSEVDETIESSLREEED